MGNIEEVIEGYESFSAQYSVEAAQVQLKLFA